MGRLAARGIPAEKVEMDRRLRLYFVCVRRGWRTSLVGLAKRGLRGSDGAGAIGCGAMPQGDMR